MLIWYLSRAKYGALVDGKDKLVTEQYLHRGVIYGDAETQCFETLRTRLKTMDVDNMNKPGYDEVVFYSGTADENALLGDPFFQVNIKAGGEKRNYLIPARDANQAITRGLKAYGWGEAKNVVSVKQTDILGVWDPHNELWQGDWWNRMERLAECRRVSRDLNQTEAFNPDGSAKTDTEPTSTGLAIRNNVEDVEAEDMGNEYDSGNTETLRPVLELPPGVTDPIDDDGKSAKKKKKKSGPRITFFGSDGLPKDEVEEPEAEPAGV